MPDENIEGDIEETLEDEGGKKRGLLVPLLVALFALGGGGAAGTLFLRPSLAPSLVSDPSEEHKESKAGPTVDSHGNVVTSMYSVENLVVNPAQSEGTRFLLVSVAIEVGDPSLVDGVAAMDVALRDVLILYFGMKTVPELADVTQRQNLIRELKVALEQVVGEGLISHIYLPQFVIQ